MIKNMSFLIIFIFKNNFLFKVLFCKNYFVFINLVIYVIDIIIRSFNMRIVVCVIVICILDIGVVSKYVIVFLFI